MGEAGLTAPDAIGDEVNGSGGVIIIAGDVDATGYRTSTSSSPARSR